MQKPPAQRREEVFSQYKDIVLESHTTAQVFLTQECGRTPACNTSQGKALQGGAA